ncbi:hypothetical protein CG709_02940 [Lachnotalea glycerini]|nr:hypothetical protein CG709_02940 [Lachnotalea glycerini]
MNHYGVRIHEQEYEALLKAKELINQNYAHPLTIAEIAKKAAMSESRLQKGFKQCFGLTVNDYIIKKRMEMAKKLLESGNYSVSAVAWMVGYTHTGYFIRRFHEEYGITPGAIKKINKKNDLNQKGLLNKGRPFCDIKKLDCDILSRKKLI